MFFYGGTVVTICYGYHKKYKSKSIDILLYLHLFIGNLEGPMKILTILFIICSIYIYIMQFYYI